MVVVGGAAERLEGGDCATLPVQDAKRHFTWGVVAVGVARHAAITVVYPSKYSLQRWCMVQDD